MVSVPPSGIGGHAPILGAPRSSSQSTDFRDRSEVCMGSPISDT